MLKIALNLIKNVTTVICLTVSTTFAQDVIIMKNGDEIQSIIQEIGIEDVKYKKFDNQSGPNYTLRKSDIFMIKYENGYMDVFTETTTNTPADKQQATTYSLAKTLSKKSTTNNKAIQPGLTYKSWTVYQDGIRLYNKEVKNIMSGDIEALQMYKSGRAIHVTGKVISYSAPLWAILLVDSSSSHESNKEFWNNFGNYALVCVTVTAVAMPFILIGSNKMKKSVHLYNSRLNSNDVSYHVKFGLTPSGVGFTMQF